MYDTLSAFAQTWGLGYFVAIFGVVLVYALWPKNRERFQNAARLPMNEKEHGDDRPVA